MPFRPFRNLGANIQSRLGAQSIPVPFTDVRAPLEYIPQGVGTAGRFIRTAAGLVGGSLALGAVAAGVAGGGPLGPLFAGRPIFGGVRTGSGSIGDDLTTRYNAAVSASLAAIAADGGTDAEYASRVDPPYHHIPDVPNTFRLARIRPDADLKILNRYRHGESREDPRVSMLEEYGREVYHNGAGLRFFFNQARVQLLQPTLETKIFSPKGILTSSPHTRQFVRHGPNSILAFLQDTVNRLPGLLPNAINTFIALTGTVRKIENAIENFPENYSSALKLSGGSRLRHTVATEFPGQLERIAANFGMSHAMKQNAISALGIALSNPNRYLWLKDVNRQSTTDELMARMDAIANGTVITPYSIPINGTLTVSSNGRPQYNVVPSITRAPRNLAEGFRLLSGGARAANGLRGQLRSLSNVVNRATPILALTGIPRPGNPLDEVNGLLNFELGWTAYNKYTRHVPYSNRSASTITGILGGLEGDQVVYNIGNAPGSPHAGNTKSPISEYLAYCIQAGGGSFGLTIGPRDSQGNDVTVRRSYINSPLASTQSIMHSRVELLDAAAVDATTEPRYRHLFQTLRKRGYPESQSDKSGARQTRMDRVDRINILPVISGGDARHQPAKGKYFVGTDNAASDMIPFTFQDVVNNKWLVFRATLNGISESTSATYNTVDYINRADSMKIYSGFARTVNFNFEVVPYSQVEMRPLWQKLNYLTGLCAPSYGTTARKGGYMVSPFVKLTIGDMYRGQTGVLTSVTLSVDDAAGWDIDYSVEFNTRRLPKHVSVSVSFDIIETQTPSRDGIYYSGPIYMGGESSVTRSGVGGSDFNLRDISIPVSEGVPVSNIPDVPVVPPRPRPPRNDMRPPPVPTVPGFNAPPPGAVTIPPTPTITPPRIRRP